jgi:hypothetical protein
MLKDLFESIVKQGESNRRPVALEVPGAGKVVISDGVTTAFHDLRKPIDLCRQFSVGTLVDLVDVTSRFAEQSEIVRDQFLLGQRGIEVTGDREPDDLDDATSTIWIKDNEIVAVCDDLTGYPKVTLPLTLSPQFAAIKGLDKAFDQLSLINFLRVTLSGTGADGYLAPFRDMRFDRSAKAGGKINHMDESLGREIENQVVSGQEIPERLKLSVPIFANPDLRYLHPITLYVTLNFQQETVTLTTAPNEVNEAFAAAKEVVRRRLTELTDSLELMFVTTG